MTADDSAVYVLTHKGSKELQASETGLSALALELMVLIDGRATLADIRKRMKSAAGAGPVADSLAELRRGGFIDLAANLVAMPSDFIEFFSTSPQQPSASALDQAQSDAASGVTSLQQQGYYVRIAMRAGPRRQSATRPVVMVIEDEASLAKFLRQYLELEGFTAMTAANRNEIVAGLRRQPPPDLVLLDVMLPDADGFNILLKMREHPVLKTVPVLMLTAKATRESVLRGLAGGANGYITKPFEPKALISAVQTVLGISKNPFDRSSD